jgi:hypothetical protein
VAGSGWRSAGVRVLVFQGPQQTLALLTECHRNTHVDDLLVCHDQSIDLLGKQEYKCTTELTGNGKDGGITFEAEIKYDPEKDECD